MRRNQILALILASGALLCLTASRHGLTQSTGPRRITNTTEEGININPSISGDGRIIAFETTEDVAGVGGSDHFRAIRANVGVDPATFFQIAGTRAVAPAISQDGSRITFASKDDPLGTNLDGNSEIFLFDDAKLNQITNTSPDNLANRVINGNFQPTISDDGRFIAFSSNRDLAGQNADRNLEIFVYDSSAASFAQLTDSSGTVGSSDAKISGDGSAVAFIRDTGTSSSAARDLIRQPRVGPGATVLGTNLQSLAMTYGRAISDDGSRVVYAAQTQTNTTQVFLFDGRAGGITRQITSLGARVTEVPLHPTISGDGSRIAFAARRSVPGAPSNSDGGVELYVYDLPTATFSKITNAPSSATADVVSSLNDDGSSVAFNFPRIISGAVTNSDTANNSEIYVTAPATRPSNGTLTAILNDASFGHEPSTIKAVAPDSIAAAQGTNLASTTLQSQRLANGTFPTNVAGTRVSVNGRAAQIFFASPTQVNFLVPPQTEIGTAEVVVTNAEDFPSRGNVPTLKAAPGVFTRTGDGIGEGQILNSDTLQEGPFDPTGGNLRLSIFTTGARNAVQTVVSMGGRFVNAESVIPSPDMPGLDEVHVRVPSDLRGTGTVKLSVISDSRESNAVSVSFLGDSSRAIFINEVLADPPDGVAGDANHDGVRDSTQDEFVELVNGSAGETIGLSGWTIKTRATGSTTETTRFTFAPGTSLPAAEAIVVFGGGTFNPADPIFGCTQVVKATSSAGLSLTNSGLTILVRDSAGNLIAQFSFGGSTGLAGDNNQSLTRSPDITGSFVQHTAALNANGRRFSAGLKTDGTPFGNCPGRLTSVTISPPSTSIVVGQTTQFTAQALDQFGRTMTGIAINFSSDNTSVATIDSASTNSSTGVATATVRARNPGTAHITASATDGSATANSTPATLTITGPALSINDVSQNEGNSGTTTLTFTVSLSTPAPTVVTFDIATADNTATVADHDYVVRTLTAQTIPAGQQTYSFAVTVNGDLKMEPNETFLVNVTNVSGASIADGQGIGTILSDDIPTLSVNDVSAAEGNSGTKTFSFTVSSSMPAPSGGVTFDIATADSSATAGSDYVARSLTAQTIPAGQTSYTFDVTVNGDTLVEPNENFFVNLSNVSANASITDGQGVGTIQNDDTALLVISQLYGGGDNSGAPFRNDFVELYNRGTATVDFSITPYSVQYASVGSNFSSSNKTNLTTGSIAPGKYFLIQESGGTTNGVALPAPDATGSISMGSTSGKVALVLGTTALAAATCPGDDGASPFNPSNTAISDLVGYGNSATTAGHCYEGAAPAGAPSNTTADFRKAGGCVDTNENGADFFLASPNPRNSGSPTGDCKPDITINDVTVTEGNSGTINATFTITLSTASANTVTVNYATADGTATAPADYQSTSGTLTFNPGDLTKTVTVLVNGDTLDEANETFFVNLTSATNGAIVDNQGQGTINDNDPAPSLSINDVSIAEANSGTTPLVFTVSLSAASGQTVTVNYATADNTAAAPGDYQSTSGTLTFNPGDTTKTISVMVNADTTFEQNETFFVNLTAPVNATLSDAQGQGTITNDDPAPPTPTLFIDNPNVAEGNSSTSVATFTVTLSPSSSNTVMVDYATVNGSATAGSDYQSTSGQLTFDPGDTSKTIQVTINGDTLVEPNETFTVHLSNPTGGAGIGTPDGTSTIANDDAADLVISQTYPGGGLTGATFTNDFVELFNQGTTTVDFAVTPYSVQFLSTSASAWAKTDLTSGTLAPGRYFLVKEASGGAAGTPLPTADATGSLNLTSTSAGKVALVVGPTLLVGDCPGDNGSPPFNPLDGTVVDFVGYGGTAATASHCYEGAGPAPYTLSNNTTADLRKFGGCQDSDDNASDFVAATPNPRNASSPINDCTAADLGITKTDSPDPVITGSNVTYTITVTNFGPAAAQSVVVSDNLPANVTFVSCASTGSGVCNSGSGNSRTITFSSFAAGASETITLVATANGPAGTPITNSVTVNSSTTDPTPANNSATATTDVNNPNSADLAISKSDSIDPVAPGGTLTYTISLTNNGPDAAQSVVVTDTLPADVTFVDCAANQGGVCGGTAASPTISFSSLANGVTATITIHVSVSNALTTGAVITNTASVTASSVDSISGNNSDSETTTIHEVNAGDVLISEFRFRGSAGANDEFIELYNPTTRTIDISGFKIFRSNNAAGTTLHATINSNVFLPAGCHYLLTNANASGPYDDGVPGDQTYSTGITDDGGIAVTLASGTASTGILDQVGLSSGSAYKEGTPLASLGTTNVDHSYERKPGGAFGNGTDTNDNSADFLLNASSSNPQNSSTGCLNTSSADLSITKTDSPDPVTIGSNITYTITVLNNGAANAQNVLVTDNLPPEVTFVSCNSTGAGVCGGSGNNRTVSAASLASGASITITIVATANGPHGGTATNTATVSSATPDSISGNNSYTATTLMQEPTPNLSIDDVTLNEGNSGPTTFSFHVTLSPASSQTVTVNYATANGTSTAGSDYTAIPSTPLTFLPTETTKTVNVTVSGDTTVEPDETFTVNLSGATNANISDAQGVGTITNDDGALVVISQIYGGGSNSGATYNADYVELLNRTSAAINITTWSIQYQAATTTTGAAWSVAALCPSGTCTIPANSYYLVRLTVPGATGAALPAPDSIPTNTINMAATAGKVALVSNSTALAGTSGSGCPSSLANVIDFVGYGTGGSGANCFEGSGAAPTISATLAAFRKSTSSSGTNGCFDSNNNNTDFSSATPSARNTASPANTCP